MAYFALGLATATKNRDGKIIEAFFPTPILAPSDALVAALAPIAGYQGNQALDITAAQSAQLAAVFAAHQQAASAAFADKAANAKQPLVLVILASDDKPQSVAEGYLKLQLISHRLVKPHGTVLDGIFGLLHNIAWTNEGPIDLPELAERQIEARLAGRVLTVDCVDKFPKMVDYVVPAGIRIADTSRVRLGAHVGEGTTVMHEGFINFNAGTTGVVLWWAMAQTSAAAHPSWVRSRVAAKWWYRLVKTLCLVQTPAWASHLAIAVLWSQACT